MIVCQHCQTESYPEDKYCSQCGQKLVNSFQTAGGKITQKAMSTGEVRFKLGMIYFKRGKYREAIKTWQKLLEEESDNAAVRQLIDEARTKLKIIDR
jgi:cytochrome c-type biogenesis protein CcmH/NrfG